jgi:hypothetical protein
MVIAGLRCAARARPPGRDTTVWEVLAQSGVISALEDCSKLNERIGLNVKVITSGARRADRHPDVPQTSEAIARDQEVVDHLAGIFAGLMGTARGTSKDGVLKFEAETFDGHEAVAAKLAEPDRGHRWWSSLHRDGAAARLEVMPECAVALRRTRREDGAPNQVNTMRWYHYAAYFFGGAFLANSIPHLGNGVSGNAFQSPFASPPGVGLSSSIVNVLWGLLNLIVGYVLVCRVGNFDLHKNRHMLVLGAGFLIMSINLALKLGRLHGGL